MNLELFPQLFTICQPDCLESLDLQGDFIFLSKTDQELSLVCPTPIAPFACRKREDGWRMFRVAGSLDFSLIGILAKIASLLAEAGVSIFALSTYETDYILVKELSLSCAIYALEAAGHIVAEK